jgi:LysR family glycine cleavage system transcriptional activator
VHEALARGDLIEPFGQGGRSTSQYAYWLIEMPGARARPELESFTRWLRDAASSTRLAIGEEQAPRMT